MKTKLLVTWIVPLLLAVGGCAEADSSGGVDDLPETDDAGTEWVNGWSCDALEETFITGNPAEDQLHDWTQADVSAAEREYMDRC